MLCAIQKAVVVSKWLETDDLETSGPAHLTDLSGGSLWVVLLLGTVQALVPVPATTTKTTTTMAAWPNPPVAA